MVVEIVLRSGPSFAQVLSIHQFTPGPRTSQVNKAVSLVETVVATGKPLIPTDSEIERCHMYILKLAIVLTIFNITDNLYVQAYHNKEARYNLHLGFCTIEFYCIV